MATAPFEILYGPMEIYTGPVNEAETDLNDAPAGNWLLLATSGSKNYGEDGVVITPEQTVEEWFSMGSTAPQKAHRTQERLTLTVMMHDLTAEHFAKVMNGATVTDTPAGTGTAGVRKFSMLRGADVTELGILVRGNVSPYIATGKAQYWIPRGYVAEVSEISYEKGVPAGMEVVFAALEHSANGFGVYSAQDAVAL